MKRTGSSKNRFERIPASRPGDEVLRRTVRSHHPLRVRPGIPGFVQFARVMLTETPLLLMLGILVVLTALVSALLFLFEYNTNDNVDSYLDTVWWALSSMQTSGNNWKPETVWGGVIGAVWSIVGTVIFYGAIIASVTVFFMRRRERTETELTNTIKRNLDDLDKLSLQELELLKDSTDNLIGLQIEQVTLRDSKRLH